MATIRDFGIPGFSPGYLQPKLKHRWRVTFSKLGLPENSTGVSIQAVTFTRPQISFAEVNIHRYVTRAWVAGKYDWQPATLACEDDITSQASRAIQGQVNRQQQIIGAGAPWLAAAPEGADYKFATAVDMLDGNTGILETWYLEGCWFQDVNWTDLAYDSSDAVKIEMKIRFDHAKQVIPNYQSPGQGSALGGDSSGNMVPEGVVIAVGVGLS